MIATKLNNSTFRCTTTSTKLIARNLSSIDTSTHYIFTWGKGTLGQLGHAKFQKTSMSVLEVDNQYIQLEPRRLVKSKNISHIACGREHTLGVTKNGDLLGWGNGYLGKNKSLEPVTIPIEKKIKFAAAGKNHNIVIDVDGQVHSWGENGGWFSGGGQLGHNNFNSLDKPTLIEAFQQTGMVAVWAGCGAQHTNILTSEGLVLSCGFGEYGRLGTGSNEDATTPQIIESLLEEEVVQVASGHSHTLAVTKTGKVYSWGRNDVGQLGHTDAFMDMYSMEIYPRQIEESCFNNTKIISVAAGKARSAAISEDGILYVWGNRLNHTPTSIPIQQFDNLKVVEVVCGGDQSHACFAVITEDRTLWTFGDKSSNMLGGSAELKSKNPEPLIVQSLKGKKVLKVFAGLGQHMAAQVEINE